MSGTAFALTPKLRESYAAGDTDELGYAAMMEAARASLRGGRRADERAGSPVLGPATTTAGSRWRPVEAAALVVSGLAALVGRAASGALGLTLAYRRCTRHIVTAEEGRGRTDCNGFGKPKGHRQTAKLFVVNRQRCG